MSRLPIIAMSLDDWRGPWAGRQQLLSRLARKGWPIVYSNGPLSIWERKTEKWRQAPLLSGSERSDGLHLDRPGRLTPSWSAVPRWNALCYRLHARHLLRQARLAKGDAGILFLFNPLLADYIDHTGLPFVAYHAFDSFSRFPNWSERHARLEARLTERAQLVLATTAGIAQDLTEPGPSKAIVLPNGGDYESFSRSADLSVPADLAAIPSPRIGYVGRLSPKVDLALIEELARRRPSWHWLFIGPVVLGDRKKNDFNQSLYESLERFKRIGNIHFLGNKPHEELPNYLAGLDVATMPYRTSGGWWVNGYPLKLHEYLASGGPVVSAGLEAIRPFGDVVDIVETADGWEAALARAIENGGVGTPQTRRAVAKANSWDQRADDLDRMLQELISGPREA